MDFNNTGNKGNIQIKVEKADLEIVRNSIEFGIFVKYSYYFC